MEKNANKFAPICVIIAGCCWGSGGVFIRVFVGLDYSPLTIVFTRTIIAFVIMLIFLLFYDKSLLKIKIKDLWAFVGIGVSGAIILNLFYNLSVMENSLSLAAILLATAPFFVLFLAAPIFKEKITAVKLQALAIAFIGCVLVSGLIGSATIFSPFGIGVGLLSGVGSAMYGLFSRAVLNRGYHPLTANIYSMGIGALATLPFTQFDVVAESIIKAPMYVGVMLFLHALFVCLLPYILFTTGMKYMDTGKAAIIVSVEPVAATFFGIFLYKEIPDVFITIGIVLVLFALVLLNLPKGFRSIIPDRKKQP